MTPRETLLAALARTPADEVGWQALADCLEEEGDPARAELLRLTRRLRDAALDGRDRVERRVNELLASGVRPCVPEYTNAVGMRLALVPAGRFWMGSAEGEGSGEWPRHEVTISRPFWLGVTPVTQAQYQAVMGKNPSWFSESGGGKDNVKGLGTSDFPVESVSWTEAVEFCRRLTETEKGSGHLYRLPTEAEWEYSCRGGAASKYHFGDNLTHAQANFGLELKRTTTVGSYPANAFGLHDMHGNVMEWCSDWHGEDFYVSTPATDPAGPSHGWYRVLRGGSWYESDAICRAACRSPCSPKLSTHSHGLRLARVPV